MSEIVIYKNQENQVKVDLTLDSGTFWLNLTQIATLFERDKSVVSRHLNNIFNEGELNREATVAKNATVQKEGSRKVNREIEYFNLDAIVSVGYRINSKRGTQFRIWATQRLKEYLIDGYSINQKRLDELQKVISVIGKSTQQDELQLNEAKGLLGIIEKYTNSFALLDRYDKAQLDTDALAHQITYEIDFYEASKVVVQLRETLISKKEATTLFGNQKDNSFEGTLRTITQTFDGVYLYPSIEEQAANLLYMIIKNHPFSDGNKRIGAFMFVWFLEKNKHRLKKTGEVKINDNGLTALALLVAQSNPSDKDILVRLIINLIKDWA